MLQRPLVRHLPFVLGSVLAFVLCEHVRLPFSNPWNIAGSFALEHYNPANNVIRFLLFISAPVLLLAMFRFLPFTRDLYPWGESAAVQGDPLRDRPGTQYISILTIVSCVFVMVIALNSSTYHSSDPTLDTLHEGETLGTSISLLNGGIPYKDIVFSHGVFQDPLRSVVAFKLFTRSIGAARTLDTLLTLLSFAALFVFLLVLYEGRLLWANLTLLVLLAALYCRWLFILSRDLLPFLFLLVAVVLLRAFREPLPRLSRLQSIGLVLFSFMPLAAMMDSVDRGYYLTAMYFITLPAIIYCFGRRSLVRVLILSTLGAGLSVLCAGIVLHWEFRPFFDFAILTVPRYWELMDGFVFPFRDPRYLLIVVLISWNVYWVFARFLTAYLGDAKATEHPRAFGAYLRMHLVEIFLVLMSVCFFRSALGRCDWEHVRYSFGIPLILFCYLVVKYRLEGTMARRPKATMILERCLGFVMVVACLAGGYRIGKQHLLTRDFPLQASDAEFIPGDYQQALLFLKANLSGRDTFLTLTSEPAWYYMLNQPCPTRFPVVWYAEPPFYQQEVVRDIKAHGVKMILYADRSEYSSLDDISASERLPIVYAYIRENYRPYATVAGMEFWIRKE